MKEYQCPQCGHIGEFWSKNTCDRCGSVVIREPVEEGYSPKADLAAFLARRDSLPYISQYIQDRLDALDADIATTEDATRAYALLQRKVELQWLQEYMRG